MAELTNTFVKGTFDKDLDLSILPQNMHRDAKNFRFYGNDGNDGVAVNIKGTTIVSDQSEGLLNLKCVGAIFDKDKDCIYYFLASTDNQTNKIVEYNVTSLASTTVLDDSQGLLNFNYNDYITGINIIEDLLIFSEYGNNTRRINIPRAKTYGKDNFTEEMIALMVKPPFTKMEITLTKTNSFSATENYIEKKMLAFSYRYRYLDGEYSVLAPFTNFAFAPSTFNYDYGTQSNLSMINKFNQVELKFNTGSKLVTEIQLVFKESNTNNAYIIDDFNKAQLGWSDNETQTFLFNNLKSSRALSNNVLLNNYSNIPVTSKSQTLIDGRLFLSNYEEDYNLIDSEGNKIELDYLVSLEPKGLSTILEPKPTVKSIRDYEVVIVYKDQWYRETTALSSKTNTVFVPINYSTKTNSLKVTIKSKPPAWARYYTFFIRQNAKSYEQFIPITFFEDGDYRWLKLEGFQIDKVKEGMYLYVKSDTFSIKTNLVQVKVLEVKSQPRNFLDFTDSAQTLQPSGNYIKVKPDINFNLNKNDLDVWHFRFYDSTQDSYFPVRNNRYQFLPINFRGTGLDDFTLDDSNFGLANLMNLMDDYEYVFTITHKGDGGFYNDKFTCRRYDRYRNTKLIYDNMEIYKDDDHFNIEFGLVIVIGHKIGHTLNDSWSLRIKSQNVLTYDYEDYAMGGYVKNIPSFIPAGANVRLTWHETGNVVRDFTYFGTASKQYEDLEHFYWGEEVDKFFDQQGFDRRNINFRWGNLGVEDNESYINITDGKSGNCTMLVRSLGKYGSMTQTRLETNIYIETFKSFVVLETEPTDTQPETFFEIGKTYNIENNYHMADTDFSNVDTNQNANTDAVVRLDWFNAWSFGNGVESYKIFDEFNQKGLDEGVRITSRLKEEYKRAYRKTDITWSDVYNSSSNFNGLSAFYSSLLNWTTLDKENGSVQKLHNYNSNVLVLQEEAVGFLPYNKNIIYSASGSDTIGISENILDKKSFKTYDSGKTGISKNPESFVAVGNRVYFTDQQHGNLIRLSNNGVTELNSNGLENEFSKLMIDNKYNKMVAGYDSKHSDYIINLPSTQECLFYSESNRSKGFAQTQTFEPDFLLGADNELYSWKNGVMYKHHTSEQRNTFYGVSYPSSLTFVVNHQVDKHKIFNAIGLHSTHPCDLSLDTNTTSRLIAKNFFEKRNEYFYAEILGNTNDNVYYNNVYGLGTYPIVNGIVTVKSMPDSIGVGDWLLSADRVTFRARIIGINNLTIQTISNNSLSSVFLMYEKDKDADGQNIKGNYMRVTLTAEETTLFKLIAVKTEAILNDKL